MDVHIITRFFRDCSGASAAEYALLLAIFGAGLGFAVYQLGIEQSAAIVRTADNILVATSGSLSGSPVAGAGAGGEPAMAAAARSSSPHGGGGNPSSNGKGGKAKASKASHSRN
jgi:pilus assembly protein Flp/PilA